MKHLSQFSFLFLFAWNVQAQSNVPTKVEWKIESSKSVSSTEAVVILSAQIPEGCYVLSEDTNSTWVPLTMFVFDQDSSLFKSSSLQILEGEKKRIPEIEKAYYSKMTTISGRVKYKAVFKLKKPTARKKITVGLNYWLFSREWSQPPKDFEFEVKFR